MKKYISVFIALLLGTFLSSCESTTPPATCSQSFTDSTLFTLSEGGLGKNNAELDAYRLKDNSLATNIISPLGDIGNDIRIFGNKVYVLLENSNKIIAFDPASPCTATSIDFPNGSTPYNM